MNSKIQNKSQIPNPKKILIIRLDRIGDVLLSTPVIKNLRDAYPDSHIAFMVRPYCRDIVEGNPYLNETIIYDKDGTEKGLAGNIKFIARLRKKRYDLAIILHPTNRSHLIAYLAGIPERAGYDKKMGLLLTKRIPHIKHLGLMHETDYSLVVLRCIGLEPKDKKLYMPLSKESELRIEKVFGDFGITPSDKVIAVNPSASCPSKIWSAERFAAAADGIASKYGAKIVVISDSKHKSIGDKVSALIKKRCLNLSGKTSVADVASVLRRSKLFISNDSGPVHIACAVGTPVVAIFGRSDKGLSPRRWGPTGERDIVLHKDVGCKVCLAHNCALGFKCLEAVTVEEVVRAADSVLGG